MSGKLYISCTPTHSHGKTGTNDERAADVFSRRAPKAEEEKGRSHLGGVHSQDGWNRRIDSPDEANIRQAMCDYHE